MEPSEQKLRYKVLLQGVIRQGCARQRMFFKLLLKVVLTLTSRE